MKTLFHSSPVGDEMMTERKRKTKAGNRTPAKLTRAQWAREEQRALERLCIRSRLDRLERLGGELGEAFCALIAEIRKADFPRG
jgi:hypothetical protein